jgi:predicted O-linked N-acetylglucosamine transferase (SPINDLY family)
MNNFFAFQNIYKIITVRYSKLDEVEKQRKIEIILKQLINLIREISTTTELDRFNTPMAFLFQHLKNDIIKIVANCLPENDRNYLQKLLFYNLDWNIRFFNSLVKLNAKDIIVWYFFQIPYFIENVKAKEKIRNIYLQMLDYFLDNWPENFIINEDEFIYISNETCMPYAIAYHNENNVEILCKYSKLLRKICPWINYYSSKLAQKILTHKKNTFISNKNGNVKKICIISDCFATDSSVLRDRIGIIGKLDSNKFDVYIASFIKDKYYKGILADVFIKKYTGIGKYIYLGSNLITARDILEKYEFDIIIYSDLGMKLLPTLLAYSRISFTQITTWGHSETSGIDTIDYYISSLCFENPDTAQRNYSEKLVLFKSLGTYYFSPKQIFIDNNPNIKLPNVKLPNIKLPNIKLPNVKSISYKTSEDLKLSIPNGANIYCCLQTFYKMNEDFEKCLARILELDINGILLLSNTYPYCQSHLARIRNIFGTEKIKRIRWIPSIEKPTFLNLISISQVCLDPFPFGGCNTSYDAFDYNIPVITWPTEFLHGRFTQGLYNKMGMADCECITSNMEQYAQVAMQIAMNEKLRHKLNRNIENNKALIFQEKESIEEWNNFLQNISN